MHLGDLQHAGLEGLAREVQQAAVLDKQGQVVLAVDPSTQPKRSPRLVNS